MERKVIKKLGTCKCKQYKQEIKELNDIVLDLKKQLTQKSLSPALQFTKEINDTTSFEEFKLPNSFSEFDAQMEIELNSKFPSIEELEEQLNEVNEVNEHEINYGGKFDIDEFNKKFEQQQKPKEEKILFRTKPKNESDGIGYKKDYNPNILPLKVVTGFEKFDNDAFNKQFEQQANVSINFEEY